MIKKHIERVKAKSPAEKNKYAFLVSFFLTSVVAGVWILSIFAHPAQYIQPLTTDVQNLANAGSLFDVVKAGFKK